jgi:tripartite-type tricarboxylate transporter receptor subunit TctC
MKIAAALVAVAALSSFIPAPLAAQDYPARPVKVIVPGPAGGGLDVVARAVIQRLADSGRGQFFVENMPGAGGSIGTAAAARAPADGYTLLIVNQDFVIHPLIKSKLPYDPFTSFAAVSLIASAPEILTVAPTMPAANMTELARLVKENPGKYNYATPGYGTSPHLANERLFRLTLGADVVHVPFQGAPPAVAATISGDTQILHITLPLVAPHIRAGKLRALAIASAQRSPHFPDVPTLAEAGLPDHEVGFWVGLMAPSGTPAAALDWLAQELRSELTQPVAKTRLESLGFDVIVGSPQVLKEHIGKESERWGRVVEDAAIQKN